MTLIDICERKNQNLDLRYSERCHRSDRIHSQRSQSAEILFLITGILLLFMRLKKPSSNHRKQETGYNLTFIKWSPIFEARRVRSDVNTLIQAVILS